MRRIAILGSLLSLVLIAPAQANLRTDVRASAAKVRHTVDKRLGRRVGGRRIEKDGVRSHGRIKPASIHQMRAYRTNLLEMLHPQRASPAVLQPASVTSTPSGWTPPPCASESGTNYSTGPDNTNPSGATGRYQIIPSTHAAHCSDLGWSPGEQDECASRIYAAQGAGAWVGCG